MNLNQFTTRARESVQEAQGIALERVNPELDLEHLHAALLADREGLVPRILERIGTDVAAVEQAFADALARFSTTWRRSAGASRSPACSRIIPPTPWRRTPCWAPRMRPGRRGTPPKR